MSISDDMDRALPALNMALDRQDRDAVYDAIVPLIVTEVGRCSLTVRLCRHLGEWARDIGGVRVDLDGHDDIADTVAAMLAAGANADQTGICTLFHTLSIPDELKLLGFIVELAIEAHA